MASHVAQFKRNFIVPTIHKYSGNKLYTNTKESWLWENTFWLEFFTEVLIKHWNKGSSKLKV